MMCVLQMREAEMREVRTDKQGAAILGGETFMEHPESGKFPVFLGSPKTGAGLRRSALVRLLGS